MYARAGLARDVRPARRRASARYGAEASENREGASDTHLAPVALHQTRHATWNSSRVTTSSTLSAGANYETLRAAGPLSFRANSGDGLNPLTMR